MAAGVAFVSSPVRRPLTPGLIREATLRSRTAARSAKNLCDRAGWRRMRGCTVRPQAPNGSWVLLFFHGVADNSVGAISQSEILLRARIQRGDEGIQRAPWRKRRCMATTAGWSATHPSSRGTRWFIRASHSYFAWGESLGAGHSHCSRGHDPRIERLVAKRRSRAWREAFHDYAGCRHTRFSAKRLRARPPGGCSIAAAKLTGFAASGVSPEKCGGSEEFSVLLICDEKQIPTCPAAMQHEFTRRLRGRKSLWVFLYRGRFTPPPLGFAPEEFRKASSSTFLRSRSSP